MIEKIIILDRVNDKDNSDNVKELPDLFFICAHLYEC